LKSAIKPDHNGATALVPPTVKLDPSTWTSYPVAGSASPETSGSPRPLNAPGLFDGGTLALACHVGIGNVALIPPPVAPSLGRSFQTTSLEIELPLRVIVVPPQASE